MGKDLDFKKIYIFFTEMTTLKSFETVVFIKQFKVLQEIYTIKLLSKLFSVDWTKANKLQPKPLSELWPISTGKL